MNRIYNLGSLNIDYVYQVDHFVSAGETLSSNKLEVFPGGKGLNQSIALAKAGAKVVHGAVVGNEGEFLLENMSAVGVDISKISRLDGSCGHAIIQVDKKGQNCILLFSGTNGLVDKAYIEDFLSDAKEGDVLLLQNEVSNIDVAFEIAHEKKMQIAFNPSPYHKDINKLPLSYVKWWFCNEIEGEALFGGKEAKQITDNFIKQYPYSAIILTLGEKGCVYRDSTQIVSHPIYKVKAVDTTAAGDTFTGYFMSAITQGNDVKSALNIASKASAIAVSRKGASSSIPFKDEVQNLDLDNDKTVTSV
ncbi:MAG: ribokinase [Clostridia bacterium]|nr:ribokinase [Clostridia bacterium]